MKLTKALGLLTIAAIVAGVIVNMKDIRPYVRISAM
jgi:hypothetical protein